MFMPIRDTQAATPKRARAPKPDRARKHAHPTADGLPREHVTEIQRVRILTAMAEVASTRGAGAASVAHIVTQAGVSRRTFYDLFEDREDCFLATFDEALAQAASTVLPAYQTRGRWRERIRAALLATLVFCEEQPALARLCIVEALAAGPQALQRRTEIVNLLLTAVDQGRSERPPRVPDPPPLAAEGAVGAVLAVIHHRLLTGGHEHEPLTSLLGELTCAIVLPYLGFQAAQKELHKPTPQIQTKKARPHSDPLDGLDMRITYRTVRVLIAIGSQTGASNREIATAAGIADQGQVSKLLTRLEHLGLIQNDGIGHAKGAANAWTLTPRGLDVEGAIRVQTAVSAAR
jgi:AcrR family transcriptional regulator